MSCEKCVFWESIAAQGIDPSDQRGECRRMPPVAWPDDSSTWESPTSTLGRWPHTTAIDWCGEFKEGKGPGSL
jgi:hypothetical protein